MKIAIPSETGDRRPGRGRAARLVRVRVMSRRRRSGARGRGAGGWPMRARSGSTRRCTARVAPRRRPQSWGRRPAARGRTSAAACERRACQRSVGRLRRDERHDTPRRASPATPRRFACSRAPACASGRAPPRHIHRGTRRGERSRKRRARGSGRREPAGGGEAVGQTHVRRRPPAGPERDRPSPSSKMAAPPGPQHSLAGGDADAHAALRAELRAANLAPQRP
eukprot:scaffold2632_cov324-Prasinococcus_capsulatus_cf.AAC.1